ncbi:DUF1120 domain-containing protein [Enterobacteriaceae bacterium H11S18]|uniref:DUF1120 domain-containing protein n=1 Tax=Dryocola clanedunensis TaxID=2925396 RepID=UPI0022F0C291|nr:DUF1120 domain-containing protein [Dryocola clanedunensis]MCT4704952.1 DUF1120 domain-containing protein [Dryocola clanedunensis]MCT4712102.1 DUF1120 domain-containing protein [Dryocola clanedunensis]
MFKQMQKTVCALAVLAVTATSAMAADSVDVKVTGTISPTACTPTLTSGGVVDYGTINANTLSADAYNVLASKQLDLSISCDAPAKVALKSINNRPNTVAGATEGAGGAAVAPVSLLNASNMPVVGLGMEGEAKIGGYTMTLSDSKVDGSEAALLTQNSGETTWNTSTNSALFSNSAAVLTSWGAASTTAPVAFETLNATLNVQAYLNKGSELDLTKEVTLDGMSTLELYYL